MIKKSLKFIMVTVITFLLMKVSFFVVNIIFKKDIFNQFFIYALFAVEFLIVYFLYSYLKQVLVDKQFTLTKSHLANIKFIYGAFLFIFLFFRDISLISPHAYNIYPLWLDPYFSFSLKDPALIFNLLIFIPYSFIFKTKFIYIMLLFVGIEVFQLLFGVGSFDINDIIFYAIGLLIGMLGLKICKCHI